MASTGFQLHTVVCWGQFLARSTVWPLDDKANLAQEIEPRKPSYVKILSDNGDDGAEMGMDKGP